MANEYMPVSRKQRLNFRLETVLQLLCKGLTNPEIARLTGIKERTVKFYVSQLFLIRDVTNRTELAGLLATREFATIETSSKDAAAIAFSANRG